MNVQTAHEFAQRPLQSMTTARGRQMHTAWVCECCYGAGRQLIKHPWQRDASVITCPQCSGTGLTTEGLRQEFARLMRDAMRRECPATA